MILRSKDKRDVLIGALVLLLGIGFLIYYLVIRSNEGFESALGAEPQLTPDPSECVVALFYADWCPHCVNFKPIFDKAKEMMEKKTCNANKLKGKNLRFVKVDCEAYPALAKQYNVNGYPTVKLITKDTVMDYEGGRDLNSMNQYFFPN
jgi:thiol-disulfide isomerase/thioredoxin